MAVGKEIREKIKSVKSTQKITRAMEMVAASKMRKAQERMEGSRPYSDKIGAVVGHLANAHPEYRHSTAIKLVQWWVILPMHIQSIVTVI